MWDEVKPELRKYTFGIFSHPFKNGDRLKFATPESSVGMTQKWRVEYC